MTTKWPHFFIVGAAKAGTTKLYGMLRAHPDIYMPPRKEIHYFNRSPQAPRDGNIFVSESDYLSYFSNARPGMLIGDVNATYMNSVFALARIAGKCPHAVVVIILREPVSRAFSQYLMCRDRYEMDLPSFGEVIRAELGMDHKSVALRAPKFVAAGEYGLWVPKWLERFGRERVGIFLFSDLVRDPKSFARRVAEFVGVDPERFPTLAFGTDSYSYAVPRARLITKLGKNRFLSYWWTRLRALGLDTSKLRTLWYKELEKPIIESDDAAFLADHYRGDIIRLESALGRSIPELHYR